MAVKYLNIILAFFFLANSLLAQKGNDTIQLKPVNVYGIPMPKYSVGSKIQVIDSVQKLRYSAGTLAQLLQEQTAIYIKEYGSGQLATISFRGTGASHTKVLWNGLSINSPTLGQSDFSTLPVFALDNIALQSGGASALYGSEALGGTIILGNDSPDFSGKNAITVQQEFGSFGKQFSGIKLKLLKGNWQSQTNIYRQSAKNDFEFTDLRGEHRTQVNAAILHHGFTQQLAYRFREGREIVVNAWYANSINEIQPTMSILQSDDKISNKAFRVAADYNASGKHGFLNIKSGYIANNQVYNGGIPIKTKQFIANINFDKDINSFHFKTGVYLSHTNANVASYAKRVSENQAELMASLRYEPNDKAQFVFNMRGVIMENEKAQLVPALGGEYNFLKNEIITVKLKSLVSLNFRAPTLNDRYWQPGGNIDLTPEKGVSAEGGLILTAKCNQLQLNAEVTYFNMRISDWILWQPQGSFWSPQNIRKVNASGIEFTANVTYDIGKVQLKWGGNYAFNKSIILSDEAHAAGKQLPYTPLHRYTIFSNVKYGNWYWQGNLNHTGLRFENTNNIDDVLNAIPPYSLFDSSLAKKIAIKKASLFISLSVQNILNKNYQNYLFRAMPGRNYSIKIKYQL